MKKTISIIYFIFLTVSLFASDDTLIPQEDLNTLHSREDIRNYVIQRTETDLQHIIRLAREDGDVPEELFFLIIQATRIYMNNGQQMPIKWDARTTLSAFSGAQEVFELIETMYRKEIFSGLHLQGRIVQLILQADFSTIQERIGCTLTVSDRNNIMQQAISLLNNRIDRFGLTVIEIGRQGENQICLEIFGSLSMLLDINNIIMGSGSLTFHIVDEEATLNFNTYYDANPASTFNLHGELINPDIVPSDVLIHGVYEIDQYGLFVQRRNLRGNPEYIAIKREVSLDGSHIRSAEVSRNNTDDRPIINFILDPEGGDIFYRFTSANVGRVIAIVLENRVRSLATIRTSIRDAVSLEGFGIDETQSIARMLRTSALPIELEIINKHFIVVTM